MNNQNLNSIINNKKAVENTQPTATPNSRITPLEPIYSGYSNVWFIDWAHPDAVHFIPFPNKMK